MRSLRNTALLLIGLAVSLTAAAQDTIVDGIVGIVGGNVVLKSDLENQYIQYRQQVAISGTATNVKCHLLEGLLFTRLLYHEATVDSVTVSDVEVSTEIDRRMRFFISQAGSPDELEKYFGKSVTQIKAELTDLVKEQLTADAEQRKVVGDLTVSPSEVRSYYRQIPRDSIPEVPSEVEVGMIVKTPVIGEAERKAARDKLEGIRQRVLKGDDFATLAVLYSEDPGSAKQGGELGFFQRGSMRPEFEAAAFKLKPGEVSDIVETEDGYHIIQLIERRGDFVNVRHILIQPQVSLSDLNKAKVLLDSVVQLISSKKQTFDNAVLLYSDDPSKNSGGLMVNVRGGANDTRFEVADLDPKVFFVIDKLKVGEISAPVKWEERGKISFRCYYLKLRTTPHKATLDDDYARIQADALKAKQSKTMNEWMDEKIKTAYIWIAPQYQSCTFEHPWIKKQ
jgi:peptidyl-prolyl cis-trans isomerase SurA